MSRKISKDQLNFRPEIQTFLNKISLFWIEPTWLISLKEKKAQINFGLKIQYWKWDSSISLLFRIGVKTKNKNFAFVRSRRLERGVRNDILSTLRLVFSEVGAVFGIGKSRVDGGYVQLFWCQEKSKETQKSVHTDWCGLGHLTVENMWRFLCSFLFSFRKGFGFGLSTEWPTLG